MPLAPPAATPAAELDLYRSLSSPSPYPSSSSSTSPPAFTLQVLFHIPLANRRGGTALVHTPTTRVEPEPRRVLLEELFWDTSSTDSETDSESVLPTMHRNALPLFRAFFALLRILPAWRVVRKLTGRKPGGGTLSRVGARSAGYASSCGCALSLLLPPPEGEPGMAEKMERMMLGFDESHSPETGAAALPPSTHTFPGVVHPAALLPLALAFAASRFRHLYRIGSALGQYAAEEGEMRSHEPVRNVFPLDASTP
ncbi:hypothetical protein K438DRAFT_2015135 [Mycena galopus ATCC 62051]|nr:hypothetical protein K438DRAFT_2015135 [Mycena galopus ATCC 62051]